MFWLFHPLGKFLAVPNHMSPHVEEQEKWGTNMHQIQTHCAVTRYFSTHQLLQLKNSEETFLSVSLIKSRSGI
jgi:hypothetical protein